MANRNKRKFEIFLWIPAMPAGLFPVTMNNWRSGCEKVPLSPPGSIIALAISSQSQSYTVLTHSRDSVNSFQSPLTLSLLPEKGDPLWWSPANSELTWTSLLIQSLMWNREMGMVQAFMLLYTQISVRETHWKGCSSYLDLNFGVDLRMDFGMV